MKKIVFCLVLPVELIFCPKMRLKFKPKIWVNVVVQKHNFFVKIYLVVMTLTTTTSMIRIYVEPNTD
jgi:hypothetical protein